MSSITNYTLSSNTITTCATAVCTAEIVFRKWGIQYFSDDSNLGRAILHGLDTSQYFLITVLPLLPSNYKISSAIKITTFFVTPHICKLFCYLTDSNSQQHFLANGIAHSIRISSKVLYLLFAIKSFSEDKAYIKKIFKLAVLGFALIRDYKITMDYAPEQYNKDFYNFLRKRSPQP